MFPQVDLKGMEAEKSMDRGLDLRGNLTASTRAYLTQGLAWPSQSPHPPPLLTCSYHRHPPHHPSQFSLHPLQ